MAPSASILQTVLGLLSGIGVLRHRKMFGGTYIYCDDLFIATVHDDKLYFKANKNTAQDFIELGLPVFSYPKLGGTATLQYYQAPEEVFSNPAVMHRWANKALTAARQDAPRASRFMELPTGRGTRCAVPLPLALAFQHCLSGSSLLASWALGGYLASAPLLA